MTSRGKATQTAQLGAFTVADRLRQARRRRFVGRTGELELFRTALTSGGSGFTVLFVHGPGGIGKTALLGALAEAAEEAGATAVRLDARTVEPSPPAFYAALGAALGLPERAAPLESLAAHSRPILFIDTYEQLVPLDNWLREEFLPELPAAALVVVAGRTPPSPHWASDPGWGELLQVVALRNLQPDDARAYLHAADVPEDLHGRVLEMTHGHPLALSLLADVVEQHRGALAPGLSLHETPDVVRVLLEHFVEWVPSPRHREALEACAHARFTTEDLLRTVLGGDDTHELFGWLRGLSFVEEDPYGVFPHDVARDVLDADLRWRDRASYADLHRRVRRHLVEQARRTRGLEQHRWAADIIFLHRNNPVMRSFWDWETFGHAFPDELRDEDRAPILAMTERYQTAEQAELVRHWMEHPAARFIPIRAGTGEPIGYGGAITLDQAGESDLAADPGAAAIWQYAQRHGPPRPGESVHAARFLIDRDGYQRPSASNNVITAWHIQHILTTPRLSWDFIACYEDGAFWEPFFAYIDYHRAHEAEYDIGTHHYAVFAHDFRRLDPAAWLELMSDREIGAPAGPPTGADPELLLSQPDFAHSVRAALRCLHRPDRLAGNPLLRSRLIRDRGDSSADTLRALVLEAAESLRVDPRDDRSFRAIDRTFLRPAGTQERAAEVLGLPFTTYRRHLARGVDRIIDWLWTQEVHGPQGPPPPPR
ncbi:AAA family ATPase [Kribbella sp. NBC_00889]|uniref:AAA family ATPase n=1 Tax=Kribbella sp. NBC_00889 TaxID=2975974 RepID=UPI0038678D03|nr:AAA family ATPase [Kribbella sp. NBC_00889]